MAKSITVPWASNLDATVPGVEQTIVQDKAKVEDSEIEFSHPKVNFTNLDAAITYFGGEDSLLGYLSDKVTEWFRGRALNRARNTSPEAAIATAVSGLVRAFVKRHGRDPNEAEMARIKAKARALMEEV